MKKNVSLWERFFGKPATEMACMRQLTPTLFFLLSVTDAAMR